MVRIHPALNLSVIANSLAMLSFILEQNGEVSLPGTGTNDGVRTLRRGWPYLGDGADDDEIVLRSVSDGLRRMHKHGQRLWRVARQGLQLYSPISHPYQSTWPIPSRKFRRPQVSPTARTTTTTPQDSPAA